MPRIRFCDTDHYGAAVLTASSAASALPVGASQDPDRSYVWRSLTQTGVQTIDIDLGSVTAVTACAVANVALLGSGVLELYERGDAATPGSATLVGTLPTQDAARRVAISFFASQSHRHWQLNWTNPTSASAAAELGFAFLGTYFEPAVNISAPFEVQLVDPSEIRASVDRQRRTVTRTAYLAGRYEWEDLAGGDRDSLDAIYRRVGRRVPLFVTIDTVLTWSTVLSYLVSPLREAFSVVSGRYQLGVEWEEAT